MTPGQANPVAGDDIVLAEPAPARPASTRPQAFRSRPCSTRSPRATAGAYVGATIDWGDGTRTTGTIVPAAGGALAVTGTHAYAHAGSYNARGHRGRLRTAHEQTLGRADPGRPALDHDERHVLALPGRGHRLDAVHRRPSRTPRRRADHARRARSRSARRRPGRSFADDSGCVLGATATPGVAICDVQFTPTQLPPAQARIVAAYGGDGAHTGSWRRRDHRRARSALHAEGAVGAGSSAHPAVLGVLATCDARANVTIAVKAVGRPQGQVQGVQSPVRRPHDERSRRPPDRARRSSRRPRGHWATCAPPSAGTSASR